VHVVGHGGLDRMLTTPLLTKEELSRGLGFDVREGPVILMIQHVLSSEYRQARFQISKTMAALARLKYRTLISYPNSDAGSDAIINTIREYSRGFRCYMYKNLPREYFVNLLRYCDVLIGNSSCGIIEAPMFGLPVVNIGNRQLNRQSAGNVIYVGHDSNAIAKAINKAVFNDAFRHKAGSCSSIYGDGHTGERIARIIDGLSIDSKLLNKPNL
jgi:UDP-hydrolysing UDP-N-acetyl-D-glucosamine 2-epimerase